MKYIQGQNRAQTLLFPISLEDAIETDNLVRVTDLFVDSIDLKSFGFKVSFTENGRPAYHPADLLKLYIYGYMNKVRSSRDLEKECKRNIEVIPMNRDKLWLLNNLKPDHNTISNFRRDNPKAIKKVFRETVRIAKHFNLIGGKLLAGDSTKLRAQNSKKNNFNQKKINRHVAYIDNKLEEHTQALAKNDGDNKQKIEEEIKKQEQRKKGYKKIENQLKESGQPQISTSDPDSRQLITRNNITEVAYNIQTTVDAKNNIPIDYKVTNTNDSKAMGSMLCRATTILGGNNFTALYDKGYHTGSEFKLAHELGVNVLVAIPTVAAQAPDPNYNVENFSFDKVNDCYTCPQGQMLHTNGRWHNAKTYRFKRYTTPACKKCPDKKLCSKAKCGKAIQRSEFQHYIDQNRRRIELNKQLYKRRQAIVEHPYGTIKRQWGFNYIMTKKTIQRATADVGLMMVVYNLRRIINTIGLDTFRSFLAKGLQFIFANFSPITLKLTQIIAVFINTRKFEHLEKKLHMIYNARILKLIQGGF